MLCMQYEHKKKMKFMNLVDIWKFKEKKINLSNEIYKSASQTN